ncbi:uncharacterized protein TEOVI_000901400 [Trypanosoma equiperdum]|uniref:Uncharacterized protein n=1 Tax=Trypanosoma equiperdum TaxID=5694 RepID=A0A1G4I217_TRYEQ|nr:hypothetical protein, conserved [Trypanosoma equiperdum]
MRATYTAWKTTVLLAMLQHVTIRVTEATGLDAAATAANTLCDEIRYLMALANRLEAKTKGATAFSETEENLAQAHRLLAQMKVGKTTAAGHTVLATIAEARAHQARSSIAAAEKVITPAVKALRARAAMALEARKKHMKTITTTEQATHNGADPNPSSSSTSCTALHTPTLAETDNCSIESDANTQVKESNIDLTKIAKLKLAPDAIFGVQKISLVARAKGTMGTINGKSSDPGWCAQGNGAKSGNDVLGAEATPQGGSITLTAEQMFDDPTAQTKCKEQHFNKAWATTTKEYLLHVTCHALKHTVTVPNSVAAETIKTLATDETAAGLAHIALGKDPKKMPTEATAKKKAVEEAFSDRVPEELCSGRQDKNTQDHCRGRRCYRHTSGYCSGKIYRKDNLLSSSADQPAKRQGPGRKQTNHRYARKNKRGRCTCQQNCGENNRSKLL